MKAIYLVILAFLLLSCSERQPLTYTSNDTNYEIEKKNYDAWKVVFSSDSIYFEDIQFISGDIGFAAGSMEFPSAPNPRLHGVIYKTTDKGMTWAKAYEIEKGKFHKIQMHDEYNGWIIGNHGVYRIDNGILKYLQSPDIMTDGFFPYHILAMDENRVIANLSYPEDCIYMTNNGGASWQKTRWANLLKDSVEIYDMSRLDNSTLVLSGYLYQGDNKDSMHYSTVFYKSEDNGLSWDKVIIDSNFYGEAYNIRFMDKMNGYIATGSKYYFTSDGGKSWTSNAIAEDFSPWDARFIYFKDRMNGWFVYDYDGSLYKTTNGGKNWISTWWNPINSIIFVDDSVGVMSGGRFIARTSSGGN